MSEAFLVASHGPCSHYYAYGEKSHDLMGYIAEVASAHKYRADGLNKIMHGIDVCGEEGKMGHRSCGSEQATEQKHAYHKEPHYKDCLLHGVAIVGDDESETAPKQCQQH